MAIPVIPYGKQCIDEQDAQAVVGMMYNDMLTQGALIEDFERAVADYCGAAYGVAFSSGTAALHGAYFASRVGAGDKVITSPLTFVATANAALYLGADVIFCDIDPSTGCLSPELTSEAVNKSASPIKAITPVSYAGYPAPIAEYRKIADKAGAFLIEDACHAMGASRGGKNGKMTGAEADITAFSFHPVKHITTGEGGMCVTNDALLAQKMKRFRTHGIIKNEPFEEHSHGPWYSEMIDLGYNYRMTEMQAALGLSQMKKIRDYNARRKEIAARYDRAFEGIASLKLPPRHDGHSYHLYPLRVEAGRRKELFIALREANIWVQVHYMPVSDNPYYKKRYGYKGGEFPEAAKFYEQEISIPMYPHLTDEEQGRVIDLIVSKCSLPSPSYPRSI